MLATQHHLVYISDNYDCAKDIHWLSANLLKLGLCVFLLCDSVQHHYFRHDVRYFMLLSDFVPIDDPGPYHMVFEHIRKIIWCLNSEHIVLIFAL